MLLLKLPTTQSESFEEPEESDPLGDSSPFAEPEGAPWRWLSSLPLLRGFPNLDRILVPMGKGSYTGKNDGLVVLLQKNNHKYIIQLTIY